MDVVRSRESTLYWSIQIRLVKAVRNIWKKYILRLCHANELILSLGQWTSKTHQIWQFMRSNNGTYMYRYTGGVQSQMYTLGKNIYSNIGTIILGKKGISNRMHNNWDRIQSKGFYSELQSS